jgi:hypothetical protein
MPIANISLFVAEHNNQQLARITEMAKVFTEN